MLMAWSISAFGGDAVMGQRVRLGGRELDDSMHEAPQRHAHEHRRADVAADAAVADAGFDRRDQRWPAAGHRRARMPARKASPPSGSEDSQFATRQRIEKHGKFLRKRDIRAAHGADLFEPGAMAFRRLRGSAHATCPWRVRRGRTSGRSGPGSTRIRARATGARGARRRPWSTHPGPTSRPAASAASTISARRRSFSSSLRSAM